MAQTKGEASGLRSFAAAERFLAEVCGDKRRAGYVLLGDESFLYDMCRRGVLATYAPPDMRDFCLHDVDLATTSIFEALDLAQTPSLMAPFQVLFLTNVKTLYGRGQKKEEFAALDDYFRRANPQALLIFVANHIHLPADVRTMDMQDKERAERIRETLGEVCGVVELQQVAHDDAMRWVTADAVARGLGCTQDAAQELVDSLSANMLLVQSELEKLMLYADAMGEQEITLLHVETMVSSAKQRSLYELTDAISRKDATQALALLQGLLNASEGGEEAAIGHVFMLAKTFRQLLVLNEKQVKDQRGIWAVLWPGFRVAPFAADALIAQARRYRDRSELISAIRWIARADIDLRSSPPDKRLVLERLVLRLAGKSADIVAQERVEA